MNVVLIGESGTGKSSLINLIAGRNITNTSNDSTPCTSQIYTYQVSIGGQLYQLWDTPGLHDASESLARTTSPSDSAIKSLLQPLRQGRVDLLVYCMLGTRAKAGVMNNYQAIRSVVPPSTPVVAIVTRLERYPGKMEDWWMNNESELARLGMNFVDHACVTALPDSTSLSKSTRDRLEYSRRAVRDLIRRRCSPCIQFPLLSLREDLEPECKDVDPSERLDVEALSDGNCSMFTPMETSNPSQKSLLRKIPSFFAFASATVR